MPSRSSLEGWFSFVTNNTILITNGLALIADAHKINIVQNKIVVGINEILFLRTRHLGKKIYFYFDDADGLLGI